MTIALGQHNRLKVVKEVDFGLYLDGGDAGEILLPSRYVPADARVGDELQVFIYLDMDERLVATTLKPRVEVGQFACLEVSWVNEHGAFLDWGLMKDLFVPFGEQKLRMRKGDRYVVHAHVDEDSYRIVASAKVERYLSKEMPTYAPGQAVSILVWQRTQLGFKAIIDHRYSGLLYANELFRPIEVGDVLTAYVKQVRPDGKIDLSLQKPGFARVGDFAPELLDYIRSQGGHIALNDRSEAELIYDTFGVSKKTFKQAVGDLYRRRLIRLTPDGIDLADGVTTTKTTK